jgi:hypothetical protein
MKQLIVAAILILPFGYSLQAQITTPASNTISKQINAMVSDHTDTIVVPTDGSDAVIVASTNILSNKQVLDLWMFVSGCAIGKHLNDNPELRMKEIWFADVSGMNSKPMTYYSLPSDIAKSVQARIHRGEIELKDGMGTISQSISKNTK